MDKAVSIQSMFTDAPFYERFGRAGRAGFTHVEFGKWTELDLSRVREELSASGVRLYAMTGADSFALTDPAIREEFHEYLSQSIAVAKVIGCGNLIIRSAESLEGNTRVAPTESVDFTGRAAAVQALMEAAKRAERAGVGLLLKATRLRANSTAGSLVKVINSPALRLLFTIDPALWSGGGVAEAFGRYKNQIGHVHIAGEGEGGERGGFWKGKLRALREFLEKELHYAGGVGFVFGEDGGKESCPGEIMSAFA